MLTPTALAKVDGVADELHLTRAEVLERLVRTSNMDADTLKTGESTDADKFEVPALWSAIAFGSALWAIAPSQKGDTP